MPTESNIARESLMSISACPLSVCRYCSLADDDAYTIIHQSSCLTQAAASANMLVLWLIRRIFKYNSRHKIASIISMCKSNRRFCIHISFTSATTRMMSEREAIGPSWEILEDITFESRDQASFNQLRLFMMVCPMLQTSSRAAKPLTASCFLMSKVWVVTFRIDIRKLMM